MVDHSVQSWGVANDKILVCLSSALMFAMPAFIGLSEQTWQSEAGSLAPLILVLGGWTLWHAVQLNMSCAAPGSMLVWSAVMVPATVVYWLASAVNMLALMALAAWVGLTASFYAMLGREMVRKCLFPLMFLGLIVPLPYSLSMQMNSGLREGISEASVHLAALMGLDVALGQGHIAVDQYVLAVENACAGTSSTVSLIAIGLLFSYWISSASLGRSLGIAAMAVPIALAANVLRVVFLLLIVSLFGSGILDTLIHPLSGIISFTIAALMLAATAKLLGYSFQRKEVISLPAVN